MLSGSLNLTAQAQLFASAMPASSMLEFYSALNSVVTQWPELDVMQQGQIFQATSEVGLSIPETEQLIAAGTPSFAARLWSRPELPAANDGNYQSFLMKLPLSDKVLQAIAKEKVLWKVVDQENLVAKFQALEDLTRIYLQNQKAGGSFALHYVSEQQAALHRQLDENKNYWELIHTPAQGHPRFYWPAYKRRPFAFQFPADQVAPPALLQWATHGKGTGYLVYVHIASAVLIQDVVCEDCCAAKAQSWHAQQILSPLSIIWNQTTDLFIVRDGHHRLWAAAQQGYHYVLGKITFTHSYRNQTYSLADMQMIDHQEHMRLIRTAGNLAAEQEDDYIYW